MLLSAPAGADVVGVLRLPRREQVQPLLAVRARQQQRVPLPRLAARPRRPRPQLGGAPLQQEAGSLKGTSQDAEMGEGEQETGHRAGPPVPGRCPQPQLVSGWQASRPLQTAAAHLVERHPQEAFCIFYFAQEPCHSVGDQVHHLEQQCTACVPNKAALAGTVQH